MDGPYLSKVLDHSNMLHDSSGAQKLAVSRQLMTYFFKKYALELTIFAKFRKLKIDSLT